MNNFTHLKCRKFKILIFIWDGKRMRKIVYKTPRNSDFDILCDLLFEETRQMFPKDRLSKESFLVIKNILARGIIW